MALVQWTHAYFEKHGVDSPRPTAEILLAQVLGCTRIDLYTHHDQPINANELAHYKALIRRRAQREPLAHILGYREFWSREFYVSPHVLIPRPETEILVAHGLSLLEGHGNAHSARVLELGVGSGAVIITLALEQPRHCYFGVERSAEALQVALKNTQRYLDSQAIRYLRGSWLTALSPRGGQFDLILSNPPYIATNELADLEPEVTAHEPHLALDGGPDGLDAVREIIFAVGPFLVPGGNLLLEVGHGQAAALEQLLQSADTFQRLEWIRDLAGHRRVACIQKKNLHAVT